MSRFVSAESSPVPLPSGDCRKGMPSIERRRSARYSCSSVGSLNVVARRDDEALLVKIRDISREGLGLICGKPLPKGTRLSITFKGTPAVVAKRSVRVIRSKQFGVCWILGCSFDRELSTEEFSSLVPRIEA